MKIVDKINEIINLEKEEQKCYQELNQAVDKHDGPRIIACNEKLQHIHNQIHTCLEQKAVLNNKLIDDLNNRLRQYYGGSNGTAK